MDRGLPGGLSQDVKDRIERNRTAAMQRKIDRRVYGPIAPNFSAAKCYDGLRENRVYKRGPEGLGYYIDVGPVQRVGLLEELHPLDVAPRYHLSSASWWVTGKAPMGRGRSRSRRRVGEGRDRGNLEWWALKPRCMKRTRCGPTMGR